MIIGSTTALGIDISDKRISLVLLKQSRKGIEFVRSEESPVPAGALEGGNIVNAAALAKTIKQLKRKIRARSVKAAISLFARPTLLQIIDMPKGLPTNLRQFIANEIKQCVVLPGKKAAFDFCGTSCNGKISDARFFVTAADGERIAQAGSNYNKGVLNIEVIEPVLPACARALYSKKINGKFDANVLVAMVHNGVLTLCVFRNQAIDFIRTKAVEKSDGRDLCNLLAVEMNEIIQFYDVEIAQSSSRWEITVVSDSVELPVDAKEILKEQVHCIDLDVRTRKDGLRDTGIIGGEKSSGASLIAAGLAMRMLNVKDHGLKINLFPAEASEVRLLRTDLLIAANIAAAVVFFLILLGGGLGLLSKKVSYDILQKSHSEQLQNAYASVWKQDAINLRINQLSNRPSGLTQLLSLQHDVDWMNFLNDVRTAIPKPVRVTSLSGNVKSQVVLEGIALSYESTHLFVNMLSKSQYIAEASLAGTEKKTQADGFVKYSINCVLAKKEAK